MNLIINPGPRKGRVTAPASKSQCNRLFLLAALGEREVKIKCGTLSNDLRAIISCLRALGSKIAECEEGVYSVSPICPGDEPIELYCGESGSCLRFLLPLAGALGKKAVFHMEGRLPDRPIAELERELCAHGMKIERRGSLLCCSGLLENGSFTLPGNCSSQYISALLMVLPRIHGNSRLSINGPVESLPYIRMTEACLKSAGVELKRSENEYIIPGGQRYDLPEFISSEGDYSSAAFFLCAGALSPEGIELRNLSLHSRQGDREIVNILRRMGAELSCSAESIMVKRGELHGTVLDASQSPDLVPALAALMSLAEGESRIINARRLRLKESDRLKSSCAMLKALGADIEELPEGLDIWGKPRLKGGITESFNDHRIAMAAALAACGCENKVEIRGAEAAAKSYPGFWEDFMSLKELK